MEHLVARMDMDVNEHGKLSNFTIIHKLKQMNSTCIVVLHYTVTYSRIINI